MSEGDATGWGPGVAPGSEIAEQEAPKPRRPSRWDERNVIGHRLPLRALNRAKRTTFLTVLAGTSCVTQAARAAGASYSAFYQLRNRDPVFAADWAAAIAEGHAMLESGLLARARGTAQPGDTLDAALAMTMLKMHDPAKAGTRSRSTARILPLRVVCDELLRRVALAAARLKERAR